MTELDEVCKEKKGGRNKKKYHVFLCALTEKDPDEFFFLDYGLEGQGSDDDAVDKGGDEYQSKDSNTLECLDRMSWVCQAC